MSIQNLVLLIAGVINLIMSFIVFNRGVKNNKINRYFSLLIFFTFLWGVGLILFNYGISIELSRFFASFIYPVALMILVSVFYLTVYFPYKSFEVSTLYKILVIIFSLFFTIFCLWGYKIFVPEAAILPVVSVVYEPWSYLLYTIILITLMLASIIILFSKFFKAEKPFKLSLKLTLIAIIMGSVAGSYFNLFLMYFNHNNYNHLGPLFTLLMNGSVFYLIFLSKK